MREAIMEDYTLGSLIKAIKRRLNNDEYDDDAIIDYLNKAQQEVLGEDKYPFMEKIDDYNDIGDGELNLPLDYQTTIQIFAIDQNAQHHKLAYIPPDTFFERPTGSTPYSYTIFANKVYVSFPDDKEILRIRHMYLAKPAEMTNTDDEPAIPEEFSEVLILGAQARAEAARDNYDYAAICQNNQANLILNMKLRYGMRNASIKSFGRPNGGKRLGGCGYAQQ